jgi:hypothetical protein
MAAAAITIANRRRLIMHPPRAMMVRILTPMVMASHWRKRGDSTAAA